MGTPNAGKGQEGAVLVHVALGLLALMAFTTFVIDSGVFWMGRSQGQNAADAGALAGAISLAYDDYTDRTTSGPAHESAQATALSNLVFGAAPRVLDTDITFPPCPDDGSAGCIRVDVYRTLPMFAGQFVGLTTQDVRAAATAKVAGGNASDCLKPWAVLDKWEENGDPSGWTVNSQFGVGTDVYVRPSPSGPGTGFYPYEVDGTPSPWLGMVLPIPLGPSVEHEGGDYVGSNGWRGALRLAGASGASDYRNAITGCVRVTQSIGDTIETEPGSFVVNQTVGPVQTLLDLDPGAQWDTTAHRVVGSAYAISPRIVAVPLVNPDPTQWQGSATQRRVPVTNIVGYFLEGVVETGRGNNKTVTVYGRLLPMPGLTSGTGGPSTFLRVITLIR